MRLGIIILAGGKGTRIKPVLGDTPKVLAKIGRVCFIDYLIKWINRWNLDSDYEIYLSTGVGHERVEAYINEAEIKIDLFQEESPLGTFGAVLNVVWQTNCKNYLILNGDTIFTVNMNYIYNKYIDNNSVPLLVLKEELRNDRYGGYKKEGNLWVPSIKDYSSISLGAIFTSRCEIKRRLKLIEPSLDLNLDIIPKVKGRNLMMDSDFIGIEGVKGIELKSDIEFIDIGVPESLEIAKKLITSIIDRNN